MTRAYYSVSSGPHGIKRCPFCKPKSNELGTPCKGTKLGPRSENIHLEFRETENAGLEGCLNQSSVSHDSVKMPHIRSLMREIRVYQNRCLKYENDPELMARLQE